MSDLITDAMVEVALDATLAHGTLAFPCEDGERTCAECGYAYGWVAGSDAVEAQRYVEHRVRAALTAAAPLIAAKALRDAADACTVTIPDALGYKVQAVFTEDLMARADRIERGRAEGRVVKRMKTTRLRNSHFGPYLQVPHLNGAGSIVLATSRYGLKPFGIRLPHQVYLRGALTIMRREGARELWALPVGVEGAWVQLVGPEPGATHPRAKS